MLFYIKQALYAFLSTFGFAILFNGPKNSLVRAGISGSIGWIIYVITKDIFSSTIAGTFIGATTVGVVGEVFAKIHKRPATVFIIPGIIPLVPGAGMYYTMLAVIKKNFITAADVGSQTLFISFSIAIALIISASISRAVIKLKEENKKKKELHNSSN